MVKAEALTKCFGKTEILKNLTCEIRDGSIYGLIGANGAGKSTLLRLIAGIYYPDDGSLKIDGEEIFDNLIKKKDVVFVADEFYIPAGCTVEQYAAMYSVFYDNFDYSFFWKHLEMLGLPLKGKIMNFSKGMKRQLVMLCALSCKCKTILFDETFDGLVLVGFQLYSSTNLQVLGYGAITLLFIFLIIPCRFIVTNWLPQEYQDTDWASSTYQLLIVSPLRLLGRILWLAVDFVVIERSIIGTLSAFTNMLVAFLQKLQQPTWLSGFLLFALGVAILLFNIGSYVHE